MSMIVLGGLPVDGDAKATSASHEEEGQIGVQACNAPLVQLLQMAAFASQGAMQYKTTQILNWVGCVRACVVGQFVKRSGTQ